ncbi:hypothetical protein O181_014517 [Austropuccinia psidii MF-1]|uniref:Uncharacterized protein n=1 Tax=Austropuccinia psidii MF-1 TaxID=1389203 RepID=A0A9Q3C0C6_9BASI|nr:hypothetical protein [Austropuccinia psidii MF-1]
MPIPIMGPRKLYYYLEGSLFEAYTDCTELKSLLNLKTTNRHKLRWQIAIQEYRDNMNSLYKEGKVHTNADGLSRWPMDNVKRNPAYNPGVASKISIHFMEVDRQKNLIFSEWEPGSGTLYNGNYESEDTEKFILRIGSPEINKEFFNTVHKYYAKHKYCRILTSLLKQTYRIPQLEFQLEEPLLRDCKDKMLFLIDGLLYNR